MICEECHGTSTCSPCAACGGSGIAHCCDGLAAVDVPLRSVALQRIIDEVRAEKNRPLTGYNRVYHRHNR